MKKTLIALCMLLGLGANAQSWQPAGDRIMTKWASEVDPACPLPEYPRPQMVRAQWQNLNGLWDYAITPAIQNTFKAEGKILVPFAPESALSGVGRMVGEDNVLWYERPLNVPKAWKGKRIMLNFGAVDWKATIYVNSVQVAEHTGGYTPFSVDITDVLKTKNNTLRIRVWDATDNSWQPRGKQVNSPRGIWYTPVTGIWQTVWMEPVPATHIVNYYAVSDIDAGTISFEVASKGLQGTDVVKVEVLEGGQGYNPEHPSTKVIASEEIKNGKAVVNIADVKTWSPDDPYLYGVKVSILRKGKVVDSVNGYTAMRKISVARTDNKYSRRMALNNKILFQFGPLDQGWWPDGLYTAPTDEALRYDIVKTKAWGFNMIRKHIKVEPARWYYYADVEGMLLWQDMPSIADHDRHMFGLSRSKELIPSQKNVWSSDSFLGGTDASVPQEWKDNYYKEWKEIIESVKCFQCIVVWVPFNEAWGQFDTPEVVKFTRELDPTRLINQSSGGNFHNVGDIQDCHHYPQPAMNAVEGKFVNVLGEYGGIGCPVAGHTWNKDKNWGYGTVMTNGKEVLDQYESFAELLKHYVMCGTAAAVYTQTTDVEVEVNGIMTYDRIVKVDEDRLRAINQSVINLECK